MFDTFTNSDWLLFWEIVVSMFTSITAIAISIITMIKNNKMIEEATRPIISIYSKYSDGVLYYIIKNFGTSTAHIDNVDTDFYIPESDGNMVEGNPFKSLCNSSLAPGDSKICPLVAHSLKNRKFTFEIGYHSTTKRYNDHFFVDGDADNPFPDTHPTVDNSEKALKAISNSLHDIKKSNL